MADPLPAFIAHGQPRFYSFYALEDTATTSLVKNGRGFLHALTLTGGTAGAVALYDNTEASGTVVANFGALALTFDGIGGSVVSRTYTFDLAFGTGLVVSTSAVDSPRLTIAYL